MDVIALVWSLAFATSAVRLAVPLIAAGVGEVISERAGVLNIGLEGMMLAGAFGGVVGADVTGSPWLGALIGMAVAVLVAIPHGVISINFSGNQVVSGVALNLGVLGMTTYLYRQMYGIEGRGEVAHFTPIAIPALSGIPVVGPVFFAQIPLAYVAVACAVIAWFVLTRTRWGLQWRAAGEDPEGLDASGVSVLRVRWSALLVCAALAGLGGVAISLGQLFAFSENMIGGRGFVVLALVIVARWNPLWALAIAVFFGAADAVSLRVQALGITLIPYQLALMLPYLLTLIAYALSASRGRAPRALGRGFYKT